MAGKRPLEINEYQNILRTINSGLEYHDKEGKKRYFAPNKKVALALMLEANLGLRISDILRLKVKTFYYEKLEIIEKKTGKLQYRNINPDLCKEVQKYAMNEGLDTDDYIIDIAYDNVGKYLRIVCRHLNIENVGTHSFRKMYATIQYQNSNNNIELVKELLNHTSIATTQRYISVNQQQINQASSSFYVEA